MGQTQRFLVVKTKDEKMITYMDYDKIDGCKFTPKNNIKFQDAINVNRMILISPTLIEKMVDKKAKKRFDYLINLLAIVLDEDDETGESLRHALNECERFRREIINKYQKYLSEEKEELLENKLAILEDELKLRLQYLMDMTNEQEYTSGKSR